MKLATESQKKYILSLMRRSSFRDQTSTDQKLGEVFKERFGFSLDGLTHEQASMSIESLKKKQEWANRTLNGGWCL